MNGKIMWQNHMNSNGMQTQMVRGGGLGHVFPMQKCSLRKVFWDLLDGVGASVSECYHVANPIQFHHPYNVN